MKIDNSRQVWAERTNEHRSAFIELLSEPKRMNVFFRSDPREGAGNVTRPADLNTEIVLSGNQINKLNVQFVF